MVDIDEHLGPADINSILVQAGLRVSHLSVQQATLEDIFLQLTTGESTHA